MELMTAQESLAIIAEIDKAQVAGTKIIDGIYSDDDMTAYLMGEVVDIDLLIENGKRNAAAALPSDYSKANVVQIDPCPKCHGAGRIPGYYHVAQGICFRCGGSGKNKN